MFEKSSESMVSSVQASISSFPAAVNLSDRLTAFTDMTALNRLETDWNYYFIKFLLNESEPNISFRADFVLHEQFNRYYFAQEETRQQEGRPNFSLGFPMVLVEADDKVLYTPLIIWELTLKPDPSKAQSWVISQEKGQNRFFNRQLRRFLSDSQVADIWPSLEQLERKEPDSSMMLATFCSEFSAASGFELREKAITLSTIPTFGEEEEVHTKPLIHWSGLFGNHSLAQYWYEPVVKTTEEEAEDPTDQAVKMLGPSILDSWQAAAFRGILQEQETQVSGKAGSGKTYLLTHLLSTLLWQGKTTLLVSSQVEDLQLLETAISEMGLGDYCFKIPNASEAMPVLQTRLNKLSQQPKSERFSPNKTFEKQLPQWQQRKEKLEQFYRQSRAKTFGPFNRIDTLAFLLRSARTEGKELLAGQLDPRDFTFVPDELERLSEAIENSEPLFNKIRTLSHPLNNLNAGIFLHKEKAEALTFIDETSQQFLDKATQLQYDFILASNNYSDQLLSWHDKAFQDLKAELDKVQKALSDYLQQFSRDTMESAKATLKLYGAISGRFQKALVAQEHMQVLYTGLEEKTQKYSLFIHPFLEGRDRKLMDELEKNLGEYEQSLHRWRAELNSAIVEDVARLNSKTVHTDLEVKDRISTLEVKFDVFIDELNASGLYQLPLQSKTLTFPKRQRFLQDCMEQLERTRLNARDFELFFDWQKHWFRLPALARRIVSALVKVRPKSWLAAFESWYFEQCLSRNHQAATRPTVDQLAEFAALDAEIRKLLIPEALKQAKAKRQQGLKQLKQNSKVWQDWSKASMPTFDQLLTICDEHLDVLTAIFPIVLITPTEAAILLEKTKAQVDYVIAWENQGLPPDVRGSMKPLGRHWVSFLNPEQAIHQELIENSYSLNTTYWQSPLDYAATGTLESSSLQVFSHPINGRFDEDGEKNEEEAQAILSQLNSIEANEQGQFPSVGIVCLTAGQRNLILTYLQQIKQQELPGHERIIELEQSGLRVLTLAALSERPYDIVYISATYGQLSVKGQLSAKMNQIDQKESLAALHQLKNIATKEWRLFHSIPEKEWKHWLGQRGNMTLYTLALYIARAHALSEGKQLPAQTSESEVRENTTFAQELAWRIAPHISTDRLRLDESWQGTQLPLIVLPVAETQAAQLFLIDGFLSQSAATDFGWEYTQQQTLIDSGYQLSTVHTQEWWKQPQIQTQQLLELIEKNQQLNVVEEEE